MISDKIKTLFFKEKKLDIYLDDSGILIQNGVSEKLYELIILLDNTKDLSSINKLDIKFIYRSVKKLFKNLQQYNHDKKSYQEAKNKLLNIKKTSPNLSAYKLYLKIMLDMHIEYIQEQVLNNSLIFSHKTLYDLFRIDADPEDIYDMDIIFELYDDLLKEFDNEYKNEQMIKETEKLHAHKKELWWQQRHQVWIKMFNTINSEVFEQIKKDNIEYILHDSFEEFKENYNKQIGKKLQEKFSFKQDRESLHYSLDIDKLQNTQYCSTDDSKALSYFIKDISKLIRDEKLIVIVLDSQTPVLEIDSKVLKKFISFKTLFQMSLGSKLYITSSSYDWIVEYLDFEKSLSFTQK